MEKNGDSPFFLNIRTMVNIKVVYTVGVLGVQSCFFFLRRVQILQQVEPPFLGHRVLLVYYLLRK